jgi:hypothetical protein
MLSVLPIAELQENWQWNDDDNIFRGTSLELSASPLCLQVLNKGLLSFASTLATLARDGSPQFVNYDDSVLVKLLSGTESTIPYWR